MNYLMYLSKRVKDLRLSKGLSQQAIADAIGISKQSVSRIESQNQSVTVETLLLLSNLFNVSVDYLLGQTDNPAINK